MASQFCSAARDDAKRVPHDTSPALLSISRTCFCAVSHLALVRLFMCSSAASATACVRSNSLRAAASVLVALVNLYFALLSACVAVRASISAWATSLVPPAAGGDGGAGCTPAAASSEASLCAEAARWRGDARGFVPRLAFRWGRGVAPRSPDARAEAGTLLAGWITQIPPPVPHRWQLCLLPALANGPKSVEHHLQCQVSGSRRRAANRPEARPSGLK